ncbi:protein of unknown function [Halolactibacillus halophilus]|uniref:DUF4956 domain-containing protein n=1 Tax=Halolactibacillus halophilus TaxID=306540 RepID=A0A1I5M776_9BACI|nr:DUF4956 domain-containing protein [Halolactibacillus halophilus]GEM01044.1 DUF4956 domain-containing protein [Halolactibacillus halophilus]SFP05399.1 protein of unknown function [Halolactibacillus halophilus]
MRDFLYQLAEQSPNLSLNDILINILMATALAVAIYISYWYTHVGTAYSRKFNVSLITLTILTATVMTVIGNNIALSLGMVGALSIVRFRTAIKDSRDTTYIFWAIIVGIGCGSGDYLVATIGSAVVFIVLLLLGRVKNNNRMLVIIKADRQVEMQVEGTVFKQFNKKAVLRVKNTTEKSIEWIYELSQKEYKLESKKDKTITELLYKLGGIEYVNIVAQSDEISG